ncbi:uncharacterized protein LOC126377986 [Pectinophora gossypiella]|uniref:uncharacterized protein LOC126377986 n=1 Tax=Pectinophora gossypiella TaxID=13191 RepID=UPI00214EAB0A|nr:uncharacterized protein LOC126377986 [Pectinophora gossypiella]
MPRAYWQLPPAPRADWLAPSPRGMRRRSLTLLLYFTFLIGFTPSLGSEWSSPRSPPPAPADAAELVRDGPLYPPLPSDLDLDPYPDLDPDNDLETSIETSNILVTPRDRTETEHETNVQTEAEDRMKRSSGQEWEKNSKQPATRRVKTGDTILNIRGAVRDAIGDAGAAPGPRASSRLDTFVIRPAAAHRLPAHDQPRAMPTTSQVPKNERELLVEAHSRARIPCDLNNVTNLRWYKDNEQINAPSSSSGGEAMWREADAIVIARATRADAAVWRCAGVDRAGKTESGKPTRLLIYEAVRSVYLAVDGRRLDAGNTWVPVRDKTVLEVRCVAEGGVPPPELTWRLLALEPALDHRPYLRIHHTNYSIEGVASSHVVVTAARELHNATLQCEARQRRPPPPAATAPPADVMTAKLEIHVTYPPSFVISRWPGFGISLSAGGAAALRCDVDANPPARAWWLRDDAHTSSSPPPLEAGDESRGSATLRWSALRTTHAGWYRCRATWLDTEYSSIGYYLNVLSAEEGVEPVTEASSEAEEPPDHQKVDVPLGGNVQLHCPKGSVGCWWRRVVGNSSESWAPAGSHHAHGVLGIKDALYQEGGEYRCVGARAPELARLRELKRVTLRVTGAATATALSAEPSGSGWRLECGACGRGVRAAWLQPAPAPATITPAVLRPDLAQHCWRAVLHVTEPHEVWCIAVTSSGGAVAVFPPRSPPSPAPAPRHSVRALLNNAGTTNPAILLLISNILVSWTHVGTV